MLDKIFNCRQDGPDAPVIGNQPLLQGDVKVDPDQNSLAGYINISNRFFIHG